MIDLEPGAVAKLIDPLAVSVLWKAAAGRASDGERDAVAAFPPLLHIPQQVHYHEDAAGAVYSVVGTWTRENLFDYFRAGPGALLPSGKNRPPWLCALGLEGAFPVRLPSAVPVLRDSLQQRCFRPANAAIFEPDSVYLPALQEWTAREAARVDLDDRDRNSAISAAKFAEIWRDACTPATLQRLGAFELELRARRMGMIAGDWFAQRLSWTQSLIGLEPVRAFNRLIAWWAAATLMPRPFRLGVLDRCFASPVLSAVFLAANIAAPALAAAAAQRALAPERLPTAGVRYAHPAAGDPAPTVLVERAFKALHGAPVFSPIPHHPERRCEMLLAVRVERTTAPVIFRQPPWLALKREHAAVHSLLVRVGDLAPDAPADAREVEVYFLSDGWRIEDLDIGGSAAAPGLARAVRQLWRAMP